MRSNRIAIAALPGRWEITRSTADTGGELFEATNWLDPSMAGPPVHVHPTAEDSFEVIEGALDFCVGGKWRTLRAGESAAAPAGVPYTLRPANGERARAINVHRPALQFESFFREMHGLISQGKIKHLPPKEPSIGHLCGNAVLEVPERPASLDGPATIGADLLRRLAGRSIAAQTN